MGGFNSIPDLAEAIRQRKIQGMMAPPPNIPTQPQQGADIIPQPPQAEGNIPSSTPAADAYTAFQQNPKSMPNIGDYHPSVKRRIGAMIAGTLAGFGDKEHGGQTGYNVAKDVMYAPYTKDLMGYQQHATQLGDAAKQEQESAIAKSKIYEEGEKAKAEVARAGAEESRRKVNEFDISPQAFQQQKELAALKQSSSLASPSTIKLLDGKEVVASFDRRLNKFVGADGMQYSLNAVDPSSVRKNVEKELSTIPATALHVFRATHAGRDPETFAELDEVNQHIPQPGVTDAREATAAKDKAQAQAVSPETIQVLTNSVLQNPDTFENLSKENQALVTVQLGQQGLSAPAKLPTEVKAREVNSMISLRHAQKIRSMLENPQIQQRLGPILGRLGKTEQFAGGTIPNVPPELQEQAQELRSRMRYLIFQEGRSVLGGRPAAQLIKQLEQVSPDTRMTMPMLLGALDAVEGTSKINREAANNYRWGGKTPIGKKADGIPSPPSNEPVYYHKTDANGKRLIMRVIGDKKEISNDGGSTWQTN